MVQLKRQHFKSLLVVCAIAVLVVIGSTVAFFTSRDESTNRFEGGSFDILLTETKWNPEAGREVMPGDELEKNPQITNVERIPGYVFLRVTVPCDSQMVDNDDGTPLGEVSAYVPMYKFMVRNGDSYDVDTTFTSAQQVHRHWQLVSGYPKRNEAEQAYVYVYAYANPSALIPLRQGEITEPLFDKLHLWNFDESYDPAQSHNVLVEALGIQADLPGYTAGQISEIWAILDRGGGGS